MWAINLRYQQNSTKLTIYQTTYTYVQIEQDASNENKQRKQDRHDNCYKVRNAIIIWPYKDNYNYNPKYE